MEQKEIEVLSRTRIFLKNNGVILPKKPLQEFYSQIFKLSGFGIGGVLNFAGKKAGKMASDMIKEIVERDDIPLEEAMEYIAVFLKETGVCSSVSYEIKEEEVRVEVKGSLFAEAFDKHKKPVCIPLSSALEGLCSDLFGGKWEVKEESCQAQGKESCVFIMVRK